MSNTDQPIVTDRSRECHQSPGQTRDNPGEVSDHKTQVNNLQADAEEVIDRKKIKWPPMADEKAWRGDEVVSRMLENTLKGTSKKKLEVMGNFIYDCGRVRIGVIKQRKQHPAPTPSRRQKEISRLRRELRPLKH